MSTRAADWGWRAFLALVIGVPFLIAVSAGVLLAWARPEWSPVVHIANGLLILSVGLVRLAVHGSRGETRTRTMDPAGAVGMVLLGVSFLAANQYVSVGTGLSGCAFIVAALIGRPRRWFAR
jgi:hypothetical protein